MTRYRIVEIQEDPPRYYAQVKGWFYWHNFGNVYPGRDGPGWVETLYFDTPEEAKNRVEEYLKPTPPKPRRKVVLAGSV